MPMYTFKCPECEDVVDVIQSMDSIDPICKKCSSTDPKTMSMRLDPVKMERVYKAPSRPKFKGSGFYETDYGGKIAMRDALEESSDTIERGKKK
mgnify:CR=1 FL=1|tara:strand:- start:255 stop:536 length:282 start_codon:yes stop_codon:yes gene_type:complete